MELRHVVTCFLTRPGDGKVLLGRRSDRVSTYPGHWAAISGSVEEAGPLEQAWREIREETGLERDRLRLLAEGWPIGFTDWDLGTVWVVHPFRFRCDAPERVRRDWEHVRFEWTDPSRIGELRTVPRLLEAWRSAREVEGPPDSRWIFDRVARDREHGAEELGLWTLRGLMRAAEEGRPFAEACREAAGLRPSMAPVRSAALEAFDVVRRAGDPSGAAEAIARLLGERERASLGPASAAMEIVPVGARLVTLSYSFTVLSVLREAADRVASLVVAESRPACEGRRTARLAASFGIETELVTDAAAAVAVAGADVVLFGADSLLEDGSVVNKAGTFALCCAARRSGVRTTAVAALSKVQPAGFEPAMEPMPPDELGEPIPGVEARNVYFEKVPADLVDRIVAGEPLDPAAIRRRAERLRRIQQGL